MQIADDHPKINFLFLVAGEADDRIRAGIQALITDLAASRNWLLGPPEFVDFVDDDVTEDETPTEILGGVLKIYSALHAKLPRAVDLTHLHEVETLIAAVQDFSREHQRKIDFELDGEFIGEIEKGELDEMLAEGLLGE